MAQRNAPTVTQAFNTRMATLMQTLNETNNAASNNLQANIQGGNTRDPGVTGFDTLLNSVFASIRENDCRPPLNVCMNKELPCFFEFLQTCTRKEEDLVYGTYCLRHTNNANRTFAVMGTQTTVDIQPISLKVAVCEPNMLLWTFLTKVTYAQAKEMISFLNINTAESSALAKFIVAVSEPMGARQNSEEYQRLHQYLSIYCQSAIKCLETVPDREKILIPMNFSYTFMERNLANRMVSEIFKKAGRNELSLQLINDKTHQIYVPLTMLNILDQINILSYRMYCGVGQISLAPNCSINDGRIFIGSGLSVQNALSSVEISKMKSFHPETIVRIVRDIHGDTVHHNYDILVMLCVPANINTVISPQIFLAKRKYVGATFDIEKMDVISYC